MKEKITKMRKWLKQLKPFWIEAGLRKDYLKIPAKIELLDSEIINEAYNWLEKIAQIHLKNLIYIHGLCSDKVWERYKKWETFDDHLEVQMRKNAIKNLKKILIKKQHKPILFIKKECNAAIKKAIKYSFS